MRTSFPVCRALVVLFAFASSSWAEGSPGFLVVVHTDNLVEELSCSDLEKIYLKRKLTWEDGTRITPVDQQAGSPVRELFSRAVFQKPASALKRYWQRMIFTGKGTPPLEVTSDREVLECIVTNPLAIGYISIGTALRPEVKIVGGCPEDEEEDSSVHVLPDLEPPPPPPPTPPPSPARPAEPPGMVYVPAGRFEMGSPTSEVGRGDDETAHWVTVTRGFFVTETELTQQQWRDFGGGRPAFFDQCGSRCPVERINWFEALRFANRLSQLANLEKCYELGGCEGTPGSGCAADEPECEGDFVCSKVEFRGLDCAGFRLPTEAEWELAARASTTAAFVTGDGFTAEDGRFGVDGKAAGPVKVGTFAANPAGLFDVHGNVGEWIWDAPGSYLEEAVEDPISSLKAGAQGLRGVRGGSWSDEAAACRSADRDWKDPSLRSAAIGFRLVKTE